MNKAQLVEKIPDKASLTKKGKAAIRRRPSASAGKGTPAGAKGAKASKAVRFKTGKA